MMTLMKRSIGEVCRDRRKALGMTQKELCACLTDYDTATLSRFENGMSRIAEARLDEIAAALDIALWELFRIRDLEEADPEALAAIMEPEPAAQIPVGGDRRRTDQAEKWPFSFPATSYAALPQSEKTRCAVYLQATIDAWQSRPNPFKNRY